MLIEAYWLPPLTQTRYQTYIRLNIRLNLDWISDSSQIFIGGSRNWKRRFQKKERFEKKSIFFWDFKNIYTDVICNSCDITITSKNINIIKKRTLFTLISISTDSIRDTKRKKNKRLVRAQIQKSSQQGNFLFIFFL